MIVEVKQGKLEGAEGKSVLSDEVYYSFLGIPYAKPPIGDLRFRVRLSYVHLKYLFSKPVNSDKFGTKVHVAMKYDYNAHTHRVYDTTR